MNCVRRLHKIPHCALPSSLAIETNKVNRKIGALTCPVTFVRNPSEARLAALADARGPEVQSATVEAGAWVENRPLRRAEGACVGRGGAGRGRGETRRQALPLAPLASPLCFSLALELEATAHQFSKNARDARTPVHR